MWNPFFDVRWTPQDLLRTMLDRTVGPQGVLPVQDDLRAPSEFFQRGIVSEPVLPPELPYDALERLVPQLVDFRQQPRGTDDKRGRPHGTRKLTKVTALWLHQTASLIGHPNQFLSVPTQGAIGMDAEALLLHPLRAYMYAAHSANRFSISIEVACRAAGIEGIPDTFWRSKRERKGYTKNGRRHPPRDYGELVHEATDEQLLSCRHLVRYYIEEVERQAQPLRDSGIFVPGIQVIGTHRNSHSSRVSDPGSRIYHEVVQWAIREFGLDEALPVGSGTPNPTAWTGSDRIPYSWKVRGF